MCFYECGDNIPNCGLDPDNKYKHLTVDFPCPFHEGRHGNRYTVFEIRKRTLDFLRELHDLDSADEETAEEQVYRSALKFQYEEDNDDNHSETEELSSKSGSNSPDYFLEMAQDIAAQDKAPAPKRSQRTKQTDRAHDWLPAKARTKMTKEQVATRLARKGAAPGWTRPAQARPVVAGSKPASAFPCPPSACEPDRKQPPSSYRQRMQQIDNKFAGAGLQSPDDPYFQRHRSMSSEYFSDESMRSASTSASTSTGVSMGMGTGSASDMYSTSHYDDYDDDDDDDDEDEELSTATSPSTRSGIPGSTATTADRQRRRHPDIAGKVGDARSQRSNSHARVRESKRDSFLTARSCGDKKCREESKDRAAGSAARQAPSLRPHPSRSQGKGRK